MGDRNLMEPTETIDDHDKGLHLSIYRGFASGSDWYDHIVRNGLWYRVKYKSSRFEKHCETPCWTNFYGGVQEYSPYYPVPEWLQPLVDEVSSLLGVRFNAILMRLYFDGGDEIAWHTDGRTFLGETPTIASLSFGASADFQMRRMHNVWPPVDGGSCNDCVDRDTPQQNFTVGDGDMLVMRGVTQKHWHHRVPVQKGRKPRLNINFRYIIAGPDAERGQKTYYKYMVYGDNPKPPFLTFAQIMAKRGGMLNFATRKRKTSCKSTVMGEHVQDTSLLPDSKNRYYGKSIDGGAASLCKNLHDDFDGDALSFLESEGNVDTSVFLSLPKEVQKELVQDWKRKGKEIGVGRKEVPVKRTKRSPTGVPTIHRFFQKPKDASS